MPDLIKILADEDIADQDDWCCPNCGWDADGGYDSNYLGSRDFRYTNNPQLSFSTVTWIEKWRCPECGTIWEYENDNI